MKIEQIITIKRSIYEQTYDAMASWFVAQKEKSFRAEQLWKWVYVKRITAFEQISNLSTSLIALLNKHFIIRSMEQEILQIAKDGTVKCLLKLSDSHIIETVLMQHTYGISICVTTQVGCNLGCSFCASGLLTKKRNLTTGEIVEQIIHFQTYLDSLQKQKRISHVVVMGIGEPFDNYDNTLDFIRIINDKRGLRIGARHITISTSGLAHKIFLFADAKLQTNLAISLHAPNDELRNQLMRINKAIPLTKLISAVHYYLSKTNRRITFEYILLKDINDKTVHALELVKLIGDQRHLIYVNLIPYNPVSELSHYQRSNKKQITAFHNILKKNGIVSVIRREHGTDIDAACGQLRSKQIYSRLGRVNLPTNV